MVRLSTAFVALAALCWGLSGGIGGILIAQGWDPVVVSFYRGAIGLLFVLVWLALRPRGSGLGSRQLWFCSAIAGLLSGLSYAVFIFGFKYAAPHGSPQAILVIAFAVLASILIRLGDADQTAAVLKTASWPLFVVLGVLGAGLSFVFYIVGLNHTAPAVASIVAMVEPVTASLFGVLVLNERLVAVQI